MPIGDVLRCTTRAYLVQSIGFALYALCIYPQYTEPLREEIIKAANSGMSKDDLPLMDSFLKESMRLYPVMMGKNEFRSHTTAII